MLGSPGRDRCTRLILLLAGGIYVSQMTMVMLCLRRSQQSSEDGRGRSDLAKCITCATSWFEEEFLTHTAPGSGCAEFGLQHDKVKELLGLDIANPDCVSRPFHGHIVDEVWYAVEGHCYRVNEARGNEVCTALCYFQSAGALFAAWQLVYFVGIAVAVAALFIVGLPLCSSVLSAIREFCPGVQYLYRAIVNSFNTDQELTDACAALRVKCFRFIVRWVTVPMAILVLLDTSTALPRFYDSMRRHFWAFEIVCNSKGRHFFESELHEMVVLMIIMLFFAIAPRFATCNTMDVAGLILGMVLSWRVTGSFDRSDDGPMAHLSMAHDDKSFEYNVLMLKVEIVIICVVFLRLRTAVIFYFLIRGVLPLQLIVTGASDRALDVLRDSVWWLDMPQTLAIPILVHIALRHEVRLLLRVKKAGYTLTLTKTLLTSMCDVVVEMNDDLKVVEGAEGLQRWVSGSSSFLPNSNFLHWIVEEQRDQVELSFRQWQSRGTEPATFAMPVSFRSGTALIRAHLYCARVSVENGVNDINTSLIGIVESVMEDTAWPAGELPLSAASHAEALGGQATHGVLEESPSMEANAEEESDQMSQGSPSRSVLSHPQEFVFEVNEAGWILCADPQISARCSLMQCDRNFLSACGPLAGDRVQEALHKAADGPAAVKVNQIMLPGLSSSRRFLITAQATAHESIRLSVRLDTDCQYRTLGTRQRNPPSMFARLMGHGRQALVFDQLELMQTLLMRRDVLWLRAVLLEGMPIQAASLRLEGRLHAAGVTRTVAQWLSAKRFADLKLAVQKASISIIPYDKDDQSSMENRLCICQPVEGVLPRLSELLPPQPREAAGRSFPCRQPRARSSAGTRREAEAGSLGESEDSEGSAVSSQREEVLATAPGMLMLSMEGHDPEITVHLLWRLQVPMPAEGSEHPPRQESVTATVFGVPHFLKL